MDWFAVEEYLGDREAVKLVMEIREDGYKTGTWNFYGAFIMSNVEAYLMRMCIESKARCANQDSSVLVWIEDQE